jgi:phage terminase Nu1 subunit (DNA packaging protein)
MSQREYARHRKSAGLTGGTLHGVQDAAERGVVTLTADGKVADADVADREWSESVKEEHLPDSGPAAGDQRVPSPLAAARTRREAAQAELRELELARRKSELIPKAEFDAHLTRVGERLRELFAECRDKLGAIPHRARQQDPSLTRVQVSMLESMVREALDDLAVELRSRGGRAG